jgi:FlaA1/EpsC-like NDP-sugar epimerase
LNVRARAISLRGRHLLVLDLIAAALSFTASLALRFDAPSEDFDRYFRAYAWFLVVVIAARIGSFIWLRLYQRVWRYASIDEVTAVVAAAVGSSILAYVPLFALIGTYPSVFSIGFPRSAAVVDTVLVIAMAGSWRFAARVLRVGRVGRRSLKTPERAVVVGGGAAAMGVLREIAANDDLGLTPIGVIADDLSPGQRLLGVPVLGNLSSLAGNVTRHRATVVLLALPSANGSMIRRLVREAAGTGARCLTVPGVAEVVAGRVTVNALREIEVEDLLRRAPARIDLAEISGWLQGRTVLITGAGGSIGSELARQAVHFGAGKLVLLGRGENSIFEVTESVRSMHQACEITPVIQDVRDREGIFRTFSTFRPDVVFHAAAHKHVPLMEQYPEEAVATNVLGTTNVILASLAEAVSSLVFISTDKAVNPSSVMGATKRVGELLIGAAARNSGRPYVCVRFGNVLSSRGSVVPTFHRQITRGGPLTITHPDATRYFMTIPEAVQLVLQSAVLARAGDTFVLDMGQPVRIVQLAEDLVRLHGLEIGKDIDIEFTGLRPGEKLVEDLYFRDERPATTSHEAIRRVERLSSTAVDLGIRVEELTRLAARGDRVGIVVALKALVPEYEPIGREEIGVDAARGANTT